MSEFLGRTECVWTATAPRTDYPRLEGQQTFDVAVVGAGIAGLTAALALAEAGRTVALIEARRIGRQVTGRSTAKITTQHSLIYRRLIDTIGKEKARLYASANQRGADYIRDVVRDNGIDCDYEQKDAFVYIGPLRDRLADLNAECEAALEFGLPADALDRAPLPFATGGALRFTGQAQFNPVKYLVGLAKVAQKAGVAVFEESRVTSVDPGKRWTVKMEGSEVSARDVLIATNTPIASPESYDKRLQPRCHLGMGFPIDEEHAPDGMFIGLDEPTHSIRTGRDDRGLVLVVLGAKFNTGQEPDVAGRFEELAHWVGENFKVGKAAWRWANEDMDTADRIPFVGTPKADAKGFYVATGFNAWGITNGTAAGLLVADQICARSNPWAELYDATRPPQKGFYKGGKGATPIRGVKELGPGGGGVIEKGEEKVAVWKDEKGAAHALSGSCTHKGCAVTWNNVERTWDCPCHGSIFAADGAVIHGPAVTPLEPAKLPDKSS